MVAVATGRYAPTVAALRRRAEEYLSREGVPSPRADAAELVAYACGWEVEDIAKRLRDPAPPRGMALLESCVRRRAAREPLQLITSTAPFLDLRLAVAPGVFVPRPETEGLALWAERLLGSKRDAVVVDLFAGVGPLAIYLAARFRSARVVAVEVDDGAAALLEANAAAHGVRVDVRRGDVRDGSLASRLPRADLVVANPPYIRTADIAALPPEVRDYEPRAALDGGPEGLAHYPAVAELAARLLRAGGSVAVEIGEDMAERVTRIFAAVGEVGVGRDLAGRDRYVWATKRGSD
jgi:release factor glutamine methyltransferase